MDGDVLTPAQLGEILTHLKAFDVLHRVQKIGADGSITMVHEDREDKVAAVKRRARGDGFD